MKKHTPRMLAILASFALIAAAVAGDSQDASEEQQAMMEAWQAAATPGEQHAALAEDAGTWKTTTKSWWQDPQGEPEVSTGTAEMEMILGGRVLVERQSGTHMGRPFTGHSMVGYDNVTGRYWSTWVDTHSTALYTSTGRYDAEEDAIVWHMDYTDPMGNEHNAKMITRRDGDDRRTFSWYEQGSDGETHKFMEIVYERQ